MPEQARGDAAPRPPRLAHAAEGRLLGPLPLALRAAAGLVKRKRKRPEEAALRRMGEAWRPWRSVASRLLWHYYARKILVPKAV